MFVKWHCVTVQTSELNCIYFNKIVCSMSSDILWRCPYIKVIIDFSVLCGFLLAPYLRRTVTVGRKEVGLFFSSPVLSLTSSFSPHAVKKLLLF